MLTPISAQTSAQTSYAASPLLDDIDAQDCRVEVVAARETALAHAMTVTRFHHNPDEVVTAAAHFEAFLADHPTAGDRALAHAMAFCNNISKKDLQARLAAAAVFAAYLEHGHTPAPVAALSDAG